MQEGQAISAEAVRAELRRILGSADFDASERNRNFLRHVVEETLAGRADRIKAYSIATSVFGRDERFDPQLDSIVRIEAGRLRRSLERYYLTGGRDNRVRIQIPRGCYVPAFVAPSPPVRSDSAGGPPSVLVAEFEEEGDQSAFPNFTRGFTRALIIALTRFTGLRVFGAETAMRRPAEEDAPNLRREFAVDYILTGGASLGPDRFEVDVLLVEARTGRAVWAESFQRHLEPSEIVALRNEVASSVARTLAQPYGIIQSDRARDADGAPPKALGSYDTVLRFYRYWRTFDRAMLEAVRTGLEDTIAAEPEYAEAFACLSLLYSNAFRFGHGAGAPGIDSRQRSITLARRALELAPSSSLAHYALGLATWFAGDPLGGVAILEAGRALNPNDTTILADLGQRYAMLAEWEKAVPLIEESYARNPAQPGSYRIGMFLYHYAHGRFEKALAEARRVEAPNVVYGHVAVAAAAARLGRRKEAAAAVAAILAIDPAYGEHAVADLESRSLAPPLIRAVVDGLAEAGLPCRPDGEGRSRRERAASARRAS
jgi:adenylate cyclase